jgi:anti-sigma factor RsiW
MNHSVFQAQLDPWLDGELAEPEAQEMESHAAQCAECAALVDARAALGKAIQAALPRRKAPAGLAQRIRQGIAGSAPSPRGDRFSTWNWVALAASLAIVAFGSWHLGARQAQSTALADEVLRSHIRSLMPGHLTDVVSTDQHTVKPWFDGVLDYSPPVYDFSGKGFPLIGGRLEYVAERPVAALIYGRRKHYISVMVWPADRNSPVATLTRSHQGYHQVHWTTAAYSYWMVSDLGSAELEEFATLLKQADAAAGQTMQ